MYLSGLEELDRKILELLSENARYTYSEIGEKLGVSRVAVKNHIDAMEQKKIIEEYTVIINPQKLGGAISCYFEIETETGTFEEVVRRLNDCPTITQIYRVTGANKLHVHAVAADQAELEKLMTECLDQLPGVEKVTTNVILSRIKDVKGLRL